MKRTLAAALLASVVLLAGCSEEPPDTTGDSNTENTQTEAPAPLPS